MSPQTAIEEKSYEPFSGWPVLVVLPTQLIGGIIQFIYVVSSMPHEPGNIVPSLFVLVASILILLIGFFGFQGIAPNDSRVLLLFGAYKGTARQSGFFWVNPFYSKRKLSLRIRNFETGSITTPEQKDATGKVTQQKTRTSGKPSKVNDRDGNPVDISAVVVWKVVNTAEALFAALKGTKLLLDRDLLLDLSCPKCNVKKDIYLPLSKVTMRDGRCEKCKGVMVTNIVHVVEAGTELAKKPLRDLAVAPYDIVKVEAEGKGVYAKLCKDRDAAMTFE